ncbi:Glycoside hydrolase, family 76 [Niveomyces insectorum RCEF 264]|uniref:mannan endo-1,6-alpha-mannosidase n=1 Tax=Niveomyces insectorum RCEF 264 TaxID=1081102 RepID=A0A162J4K7_9HYPO|nr:Glycoside hydrolase, family 76 [Niveomyces insectorum RCEF 264]
MAQDMLSFYSGNKPGGTPGLLPEPYYWWEAGAMLGSLIDYWYYTGDDQYNDLTMQGLLFQATDNGDFMPQNETLNEGNDDQGFWGLAVMTAAEYNFPNPPPDRQQWLGMAQAVFNTQAARWETADCNGGLRWQIFRWNNGFDYKNSISQACFFNLAARLALYTGNASYSDWAVRTYDWMVGVKFLDDNYYIYDGAHIATNCTQLTPYQWTYNPGAFLLGAAAMYRYTELNNDTDGAALWRERVSGLLNGTHIFFTGDQNNIMTEVACETVGLCDLDQQSFKAYLSRWMAATTKWAPWTADTILPLLRASSVAAARQCTGGNNGRMCGLRWNGTWDGSTGVGQQMAAMEVTLANMIKDVSAPVTNDTGGTSQGNPGGGGSDIGRINPPSIDELLGPVTTGDRVGAGILTVLVLLGLLAGILYMFIDEGVERTPTERWHGFVAAVGKNSKALVGRGGEKPDGGGDATAVVTADAGAGGGIGADMSEKKSLPALAAAMRVLTGSTSDRSSDSLNSNDGAFAAPRQRSVQFARPPPVAGPSGGESSTANASRRQNNNNNNNNDLPPHHGFFSPAHYRKSTGGEIGSSHASGSGSGSGSRRARLTRMSDPGLTRVVQVPDAVAPVPAPTMATTASNDKDDDVAPSVRRSTGPGAASAGDGSRRRSTIKRRPVS